MGKTTSNQNDHKPEESMAKSLLLWTAIIQLPLVLIGYGIAYGVQGEFGLGVMPVSLIDAYQLFWIVMARIANNPEAINTAWVAIMQSYLKILFPWGLIAAAITLFLIARYSNQLGLTKNGQVQTTLSRVKKQLMVDWERDQGEKWYAQIIRAIARATTLSVGSLLALVATNFLFLAVPVVLTLFSAMGLIVGSGYVSQIRALPVCGAQDQKKELPLDQSINASCEKIWQGNRLLASGRHVLNLGDAILIFDAKDNTAKKFIFKDSDYRITSY